MDATDILNSIDDNAPVWLKHTLKTIFYHPGTPWFFIGAGIEAISISVSFLFVGAAYPTADAITSLLIGFFILYYVRKNGDGGCKC